MLNRLRRRCMAYRTLWVALLLLSLVWQPMLFAASKVHASEHLILTGHAHDAEHDGPGIPADELMSSDGSEVWHVLLHLGHCCGQGSALPSDDLLLPAPLRPTSASVGPPSLLQSLILPQPVRPPIRV